MKMVDALKVEEEAWIKKGLAITIDTGVEWTVCPDHGMAHPLDFPCKACIAEMAS